MWARTQITDKRHNVAKKYWQRCYLKSPVTKSAQLWACLVNIHYLASLLLRGLEDKSLPTLILHKTKRHQRALNRIS